jgi:hypothetical protein
MDRTGLQSLAGPLPQSRVSPVRPDRCGSLVTGRENSAQAAENVVLFGTGCVKFLEMITDSGLGGTGIGEQPMRMVFTLQSVKVVC